MEKLAVAWALLGGVLLIAIVLVTATNVGAFTLDRLAGLFGGAVSGLPGYEDFVRLAISAAVPMFFPYCQLKRGHVAVDIFVSHFSAQLRRGLDRFSLLVIAAMALFLTYWLILGMNETRADGALSRVLGWPEWPFYLPGIISLALWALIAVAQFFKAEEHV